MKTMLISRLPPDFSCYRYLVLLLPISIIALIWLPIIEKYSVTNVHILDSQIQDSRFMPERKVLEELANVRWFPEDRLEDGAIIDLAKSILAQEYVVPGGNSDPIGVPFSESDIDRGLPRSQLFLAGLGLPRILLQAYEISGRDDFLYTAGEIILAWGSYERQAILPRGKLWNDHAIADRILVLAHFWQHYRSHPSFNIENARQILEFANRSCQMLANPSHFTYSTNHGIIQNLALLHASLAFPSLFNKELYVQLSLSRLNDQLEYLVNDEGLFLEHSAGYHRSGVQQLSWGLRYLSMLGLAVPAAWRLKYEKAIGYLAQLKRPDSSLPLIGDTDHMKVDPVIATFDTQGGVKIGSAKYDWPKRTRFSLYGASGYSVWWARLNKAPRADQLIQTVIAWQYYPIFGHKHADEMSVLQWAGGQSFWTNSGYLPYGSKDRAGATSWSGSNAPHLIGEKKDSSRNTQLLWSHSSKDLTFIDLKRVGPDEYSARRQVLGIKDTIFLVLDHIEGKTGSQSRTVWTLSPGIGVEELGSHSRAFKLYSDLDKKGPALFVHFLDSEEVHLFRAYGETSPFAGWVLGEKGKGVAEPTSAFIIEQPASTSTSVVVWSVAHPNHISSSMADVPTFDSDRGPEDWSIAIPYNAGVLRLHRLHNQIYLEDVGSTKQLFLKQPKDLIIEINDTYAKFSVAANKYSQQIHDSLRSRKKFSILLLIVLCLQVLFILLVKGIRTPLWISFNIVVWIPVFVMIVARFS